MKCKIYYILSALPVVGSDAFPLALLRRPHSGVDRVDRLEDAAAHLPELADGGGRVGGNAVAAAAAVGLEVVFLGVGSRLTE